MEPQIPRGRCSAQTKRGGQCFQPVYGSETVCFLHDPTKAEERLSLLRERGREGSAARQRVDKERREERLRTITAVINFDTLSKVRKVLEDEADNVRMAEKDPVKRATAIARLAAVALACFRSGELEQEIDDLRKQLAEKGGEDRTVKLVWSDAKK